MTTYSPDEIVNRFPQTPLAISRQPDDRDPGEGTAVPRAARGARRIRHRQCWDVIGRVDKLIEDLHARRERWGISYYVIFEP